MRHYYETVLPEQINKGADEYGFEIGVTYFARFVNTIRVKF